jgi:hypothetical protein
MSPRGGPCNHRECLSWGEGCRMLTDEELTPTDEDMAFARRLIAEGYLQTSGKYRHVMGPQPKVPSIKELIKPEMLDTPAGRELAKIWEDHLPHFLQTLVRNGAQTVELTVKQFRAYKSLGGGPWPVKS